MYNDSSKILTRLKRRDGDNKRAVTCSCEPTHTQIRRYLKTEKYGALPWLKARE